MNRTEVLFARGQRITDMWRPPVGSVTEAGLGPNLNLGIFGQVEKEGDGWGKLHKQECKIEHKGRNAFYFAFFYVAKNTPS